MPKTVLITGAYGTIGNAIAELMAERGWNVILAGRCRDSLHKVCASIALPTRNQSVTPAVVDLSREAEIRRLAASIDGPIDVLINNAATTPPGRLQTPEGIEMQWACNVMGYVWMMEYFLPKINKGGRIVNVASYYAGNLDITDVEFKRRRYDNDTAYRQSKQANRMLSTHFAVLCKPLGINVNSCHPGEISSKLSNNLGFFFPDPPRKGADTPVWAATDEELHNVTGQYFQYRKILQCSFSKDPDANLALYNLCKTYFGRS